MKLVDQIRNGEVDINIHQLFFSKLIKALMLNLTELMTVRGEHIPHMIINTGDDTMWLLEKDYNFAIEPYENTNEQYVYNIIPRGVIEMGSLDTLPDQLTNPYARGYFQYEKDGQIQTFSAEVRRMPVRVGIDVKYYLPSFTDMLELIQHTVTKLAYIRNFKFVYLGQTILASYKIPEAYDGEHMVDMDGMTTDNKARIVDLQLEVESTLPVYSERTAVEADNVIINPQQNLHMWHDETSTRDNSTRAGYRGFGARRDQG
jgi:hypothetical protein